MFRVLLLLCALIHVVEKRASAEQINQCRESFIAESCNVRPVKNVLVANEAKYYQRAVLSALGRPFVTPFQRSSDSHQGILFAGGQGADGDFHGRVYDASGNVSRIRLGS
jgi:hypothetical protein